MFPATQKNSLYCTELEGLWLLWLLVAVLSQLSPLYALSPYFFWIISFPTFVVLRITLIIIVDYKLFNINCYKYVIR